MPRAYASAVIDSPVEDVWKHVHDFNNVAAWHPAVAESRVEDGGAGDRVGCVRVLRMTDGADVRERLTALSDTEHSYSYSVVDSPFPIRGHRSTVSFLPVTADGQTFVQWSAEFEVTAGNPDEVVEGVVQGTMMPGFAGLARLAGQPR